MYYHRLYRLLTSLCNLWYYVLVISNISLLCFENSVCEDPHEIVFAYLYFTY